MKYFCQIKILLPLFFLVSCGERVTVVYSTPANLSWLSAPSQIENHQTQSGDPAQKTDVIFGKRLIWEKSKNKKAILLGVWHHQDKQIQNSMVAMNDVANMSSFLTNSFGYFEENVKVLSNAAYLDFKMWFGEAGDSKGLIDGFIDPDDELFIYYSGHGSPPPAGGAAYLIPSDCRLDYLEFTGYSLERLIQKIADIQCRKKTLVIESCFSGLSHVGGHFKGISPVRIKVDNPLAKIEGAVYLSAASSRQVAVWDMDKSMSVFTYWLLKGLEGEADSTNDREITLEGLKQYVKRNVARESRKIKNVEQIPTFMFTNGEKVISVSP